MVLMEFSVIPLGRGESVSDSVARCIDLVDNSGLAYQLTAMGTIVEGELPQVLELVQQCVETLAAESNRVTASIKLDYRAGGGGRIESKVQSIKEKRQRPTAS